jgi:TPR repeat protein
MQQAAPCIRVLARTLSTRTAHASTASSALGTSAAKPAPCTAAGAASTLSHATRPHAQPQRRHCLRQRRFCCSLATTGAASVRAVSGAPSAAAAAAVVVDADATEAERLLDALVDQAVLWREDGGSAQRETVARALALAQAAADRGCARGRAILGCMHRDGVGVPRDGRVAEELLQLSADAGDRDAMFALGTLLVDALKTSEQGLSVARATAADKPEIVVDVDDNGTPRARFELDLGTDAGPETPAALVRHVRKARRKAGFTDLDALAFENHKEEQVGLDHARCKARAVALFRKAADAGVQEASVALANEIVAEDPSAALALYENAAKHGHVPSAHFNLGQLYSTGLNGVPVDEKLALKHFSMAANLGDASAQFYVGHVYRVGDLGVTSDQAMCLQFIQQAALQDHPAAMYYLALMHRNGEGGLEANNGTFRRYLDRACDLGDGDALACLADMYYKGSDGASVDYKQALMLYKRAGEAGNADALCSAAALHFHGRGTDKDEHEAFLLYQDAAVMGSVTALQNLASCYYHGHGTPKSDSIADHFVALVDEYHEKQRADAHKVTTSGMRTVDADARDMRHREVDN